MTDQVDSSEADTRRLVVSIIDFLRDQFSVRTDFVPEDRDCLQIAIECLETAFGLEDNGHIQCRPNRPLMDIYNQVNNPVSVKDKLRAESHKEKGNNYMRRRMFDNAETEYTNAIELDKWNAIYYANRASARIEQHNFFEAIADCRQALGLNPDYAKAHSRMGQAYALLDRPRDAARCFRQALELEPDNEKHRNNLRVAESQINTSGAEELITALLLSTLFGQASRSSERSNSTMMPTSFMIITESHPPVPDRPPQTAQRAQNGESCQISGSCSRNANCTQETQPPVTPYNSINNVLFQHPFGIINEGTEEQPLPTFVETTVNEPDEEVVTNIPLIGFDIISETESLQPESTLQNVEIVDEGRAGNLQNTDLDKNKDKNTDAEENEDDIMLIDGPLKGFGNGTLASETSQATKYFPSGPEYIYHPSINNDEKEDQKCQTEISASQKDTKCDGKSNVNVKKNEKRKEGEPSERMVFEDDID